MMSFLWEGGHIIQHSLFHFPFMADFLEWLIFSSPSPFPLGKHFFLSLPGPQSEIAVSKVTSDFLISRSKAIFYLYLYAMSQGLSSPQNPFRVVLSPYISDYPSSVPFDGFSFCFLTMGSLETQSLAFCSFIFTLFLFPLKCDPLKLPVSVKGDTIL